MNEHGLDAMIYAWVVMKEKEEKMEGIYVGKISRSKIDKDSADLLFIDHRQDISHLDSVIEYDDTAYCLVPSDDIIINNDELLKLRDEVKELKIQIEMMEAANTDQAKTLLAVTKNRDYFEEQADCVEKKYGELVAEHTKLQEELMTIKTTRKLREAYIAGVEKGCESLREDRDYWKNRFNSVVTDVSKTLEANGVDFKVKAIDGNKWNVIIDIPELNESKKKIADLEKELAAAKSNETFWRDRKEEEEDYHHYWLHTFDRVVEQAAEKGIHIDVRTTDEECNAGVVVVDNVKAEELEKQVVQMEDANQELRKRISAADEKIEELENRTYWRNTYYAAVAAARNEGVIITKQGMDLDRKVAIVKVTNVGAEALKRHIKRLEDDNSAKAEAVVAAKDRGDYWKGESDAMVHNYHNLEKSQEKKWSAMTEALKDKGVEVIYMGEEDSKPIIDVKVPKLTQANETVGKINAAYVRVMGERDELKEKCDILRKDGALKGQQILKLKADLNDLKKELKDLKSRTLDKVEIRLSMGDIVWTYCDGFCHVSSNIDIEHINCLCKNHVAVDAESISHGTIPTCKSCAHYMHKHSLFAHDWCCKPVSKEGPGIIRRLSKEEADGPACVYFKARKE